MNTLYIDHDARSNPAYLTKRGKKPIRVDRIRRFRGRSPIVHNDVYVRSDDLATEIAESKEWEGIFKEAAKRGYDRVILPDGTEVLLNENGMANPSQELPPSPKVKPSGVRPLWGEK